MATTAKTKTTQRKAAAPKKAQSAPTAARRAKRGDGAERATELTGDVLEQLKNGGDAALEAVRDFVDKEYEALRGIVDSAGKQARKSKS